MAKINVNITLDYNIVELIKLRKKQDENFILSNLIEDLLRDFFKEDLNDPNFDKKLLIAEEFELQKKLAIIKAQKETIERVKTDMELKEKEYYKEFGMKKKDARIIKGNADDYIY